MVRKFYYVLFLIIISIVSMAGCNSISTAKKSSASSKDKTTTTDDTKKDVTLTVWCWDKFNIDAMKTAADIYKKDNPNVIVNIEEKTSYDIQNLVDSYSASGKLDELPDIFLMDDQVFVKHLKTHPEVFYDFSNSKIDFTKFSNSKVENSVVDGKNYGIPYDSNTVIACYRTDYLEQAGYSVKDITDITWDKFIEIGKDITKKTGMPMLTNVKNEPDLLYMILQSAGISVFDKDANPYLVGNDGLKEAANIYMKLVKEGIIAGQTDWAGYQSSINDGKTVGTINGSWICATIMSTTDKTQEGKWAVTNMPSLNDYPNATNYSAQGGSTWAVSANSKNIDIVEDFLATTWAGSTDFYDSILKDLGAIGTYLPASESDIYNNNVNFFNNEPIYSKIVEFGKNVPTINKGVYLAEEKAELAVAISDVIDGKSDFDTAIKKAQEKIDASNVK